MFKIQEIDAATMAFPARVSHLMPAYKEIPEEFRDSNNKTKWNQLVRDWFFKGITNLDLAPKEGVDPEKALRHIRAIMGSYEPKHEHKEAACAFLFNEWFDGVKYEVMEKEKA